VRARLSLLDKISARPLGFTRITEKSHAKNVMYFLDRRGGGAYAPYATGLMLVTRGTSCWQSGLEYNEVACTPLLYNKRPAQMLLSSKQRDE